LPLSRTTAFSADGPPSPSTLSHQLHDRADFSFPYSTGFKTEPVFVGGNFNSTGLFFSLLEKMVDPLSPPVRFSQFLMLNRLVSLPVLKARGPSQKLGLPFVQHVLPRGSPLRRLEHSPSCPVRTGQQDTETSPARPPPMSKSSCLGNVFTPRACR